MTLIPITDPEDPRLADYRGVSDPELSARSGVFVAEGRLVVRRLLTESSLAARSVLVTPAARDALRDVLAARPDLPVYVVPQALMNGITGFNIHRGCLAIGERPARAQWREVVASASKQEAATLVLLERVANADNVGSVFRNAAAFGASAVLLDAACTDPLYRKAIRTSMGASLLMPFARAEPFRHALDELRSQGLTLVAMTPAATATPLADCVAQVRNRPVAIVLGHEGEGLSAAALEACSVQARIPMAPGVSLNVATAAAIALYEFARRRSGT